MEAIHMVKFVTEEREVKFKSLEDMIIVTEKLDEESHTVTFTKQEFESAIQQLEKKRLGICG
ncbi:hypothetical protein FOT98_18370 [Bacillus sp. HY001]|uniref:hypothetical protein n=1 Tax=Bacillus TaxID=1386 RepID=UPI0011871C04|nr:MULTISPECIES: hypothetical protein [Bacillus]TSI12488.1 hypothetical protein FOT98_18370 [Bacillus sp. HY001]